MPHKKNKIRVGVLFGGRSGEHEVSLVSANAVIQNLDKEKYEVLPIGITKEGRWIAGPMALELLKLDLQPNKSNVLLRPEPTTELATIDTNATEKLDVIFPVLHGPYGEDGTVQGFLEMTNLPYVGCGVLASAVGMDKITQKRLFQASGITTPNFIALDAESYQPEGNDSVSQRVQQEIGFPCFVKPSNMGSSVGISKVKIIDALVPAFAEAFRYDRRVLVERAVLEPREIEISVLGNGPYEISVPGEIIPSNEFYDYHAKYVDGKSQSIIPAALESEQVKQITALAGRVAELLDIAGMARVDFLLSKITGELFVNEVNTIPGFTSISMYPKLWSASGLGYQNLLDRLITLAIARHKQKQTLATSYTGAGEWYK